MTAAAARRRDRADAAPSAIRPRPLVIDCASTAAPRRSSESAAAALAAAPIGAPAFAAAVAARAAGRPVYLVATDRDGAELIALRLGGVAGIIAPGQVRDYFAGDQFDLVSAAPPSRAAHLRCLRPHQWAKNALLFVPLVTAHHFALAAIATQLVALLAFCAAASAAYIVNDLVDLDADRRHPRKRHRPFASGAVPPAHGIVMAALLAPAALALALAVSPDFAAVLALYVAATFAYSLKLKRQLILDVVMLGGLYTVRVAAGIVAAGTLWSPWLLLFSLFLFSCLALVKRCSELVAMRAEGRSEAAGRSYRIEDLPALTALAAAAGMAAVMVFGLYLSSPELATLYRHPARLWGACPLLLAWIARVILLSCRGELHDDPVIFALTDRQSLATGACVALVMAAAI